MAISIRGNAGAWGAANALTQTVTLPTHATGDMLLVRVTFKHATMPTTVTCGTAGWAKVSTQYNSGTNASANGTGSVIVAVFWKEATSASETSPVITYHATVAATPSMACAVVYQRASTEAWITPVGAGGPTGTATAISATIGTHISTTAGDMVDFFYSQGDNNTLTVPTFTQAGLTLGTVAEQPATAGIDALSNDIDADGGYRLVSSGTSSAAAVVTGTSTAGDEGSAWTTRLRVVASTTYTGSFTADSVILRAYTGSFTADSTIKNTITPTGLTADAYIKKTMYSANYSSTVLTDSPVGYWRMGEPSGTTIDNATGNATYDGVLVGGVTLGQVGALSGDSDTAAIFDGTTGFMRVGSGVTIPLADNFTIEAWFKYDVATSTRRIFAESGTGVAPGMSIGATANRLRVTCNSGVLATNTYNLTAGNWYHAVWTKNGATNALYINGVADTPTWTNYTCTTPTGGGDTYWGVNGNGVDEKFDGTFDELAVYSTALSAAQVLAHYTAGTAGGGITADAVIIKTSTASFTADSYVKSTITTGLTADAYIKTTQGLGGSGTITRETFNSGGSGAATTSHTVTLPSGIANNDYVTVGLAFNGSVSTITPPSGWSLIGSVTALSNPKLYVYGKKQSGGETTATWTTTNSIYSGYVTARYSGVDQTTPLDATEAGSFGLAEDSVAFTIDDIITASANAMVFAYISANSSANRITESGPLTEIAEAFGTSIKDIEGDDGIQVTAGSTSNLQYTINAALNYAALASALKPAPGSGLTISADAVIGAVAATTYNGSVSADSYITRTYAGSLTADAQIKNTLAGSVTADAEIVQVFTGSVTADSYILRSYSGSYTADSYVKRLSLTGSLTSDAYIKRTYNFTTAGGATLAQDSFTGSLIALTSHTPEVGGGWAWVAGDIPWRSGAGSVVANNDLGFPNVARITGANLGDGDVLLTYNRASDPSGSLTGVFARGTSTHWYSARLTSTGMWEVNGVTTGPIWTAIGSGTRADLASVAQIRVRLNVEGSSPTSVKARFWDASGAEPGTWDFSSTNNTAVLQRASGYMGIVLGADYDNGSSYADNFLASAAGSTADGSPLSADAYVKKLDIAGSFTADSYIKKTLSGSFTADSYIKKTLSGSLTADANINSSVATYTGSVSADAAIMRIYAGSFTADADILRIYSASLTADSAILRSYSGSFTADALILRVYSGSLTSDSTIKSTLSGTVSADSYIKRLALSGSFTADAYVSKVLSGSVLADAVISKVFAGSLTADAVIKRTYTASVVADATLKNTMLGSATADSYIKRLGLASSFTADAVVLRVYGSTLTADSVILRTFSTSLTADAVVMKVGSGSLTADAYIQRAFGGSFSADAEVLVNAQTYSGSVSADSVILKVQAGSVNADAQIKSTIGSSVTADALVKKLGNTFTFSADAAIKATVAGAISADASIKATILGSLTADAYLQKTFGSSISADAFIKKTITGSVTSDANIKAAIEGSLSADANIKATVTGALTANAELRRVSIPVWTTPLDTVIISETPVLNFTIPMAVGPMHFYLQLDKVNTFDGGDLRNITTVASGVGWEYWNGSGWTAFPSAGVSESYAGNEARYTVQTEFSTGVWYRRIRGGA